MTSIHSFGLRRETPQDDASQPVRSSLRHDGRDVGVSLEGVTLEAQFRVEPDRYLLLVTDDSPYEEQLHVYLLDSRFSVIDALHLGSPYTPGILKDLRLTDDNRLEFAFHGDKRYRLILHREPRRIWRKPLGVRAARRFPRKRHLELTTDS